MQDGVLASTLKLLEIGVPRRLVTRVVAFHFALVTLIIVKLETVGERATLALYQFFSSIPNLHTATME